MGRGIPALLGAILVAALVLGGPSAANAACYSSTASDTRFDDAVGDAEAGLSPDILGVVALTDASCGIGIGVALDRGSAEGALLAGDSVGIYINVDGNKATGSPTWDGADRVVIIAGASGPDFPPTLGVWNGSEFSFAGARELTPAGAGGFVSDFDELGVASPTTLGIQTIAMWEGVYDNYADFAPDVAVSPFSFPVRFSTTAPQPPPARLPIKPPSTTPEEESGSRRQPRRCKVPKLKGHTRKSAVRRLRRARCKYRFVTTKRGRRPGRVVSTSPAAGRRTSRRVIVRITASRRARASQVRTVTRLERLMSATRAR